MHFKRAFKLAMVHNGPLWGDLTGVAGHPNYHVKVVKLKYYVDGRVTSPKRVTSPTWGPPPPCTRALR